MHKTQQTVDNEAAFDAMKELSNICQMLCYTEISVDSERPSWQTEKTSKLWNNLGKIEGGKLRLAMLSKSQDIWPTFKKLFGGLPDV